MILVKKMFILLALCLIFCNGNTNKQADDAQSSLPINHLQQSKRIRLPQKWALLVGIDDYRSSKINDLDGCVNDVERLKFLLTTKFEFPEHNIKTLINNQATHQAIVQAFQQHLIANAQPNDIVIFHYSGHGSQMKDISGDEIDGKDETFVPYDSRQKDIFDINDDQLNGLIHRLSQKTEYITIILDCCHSGSGTRAAQKIRSIPDDLRVPPSAPEYALSARGIGEGESGFRLDTLKYVLIAGCRANEIAAEYEASGIRYGALSYFLTTELNCAADSVTYRDIMDNVIGNVNARYSLQHPQLEGANADHYVFSQASRMAQPYFLVSPHEEEQNKVIINAGQIHGLTENSIFEIYTPGAKVFQPPEKPIARVKLTQVMAHQAEAIIISGDRPTPHSRAVEREHFYPDLKLHVYFDNMTRSTTLRSIKAELDHYEFIKILSKPQNYHLLLRQINDEIAIEGADTVEVSPRFSGNDPRVVTAVTNEVTNRARWYNMLAITNPAPEFDIKFSVKAEKAGRTRDPFPNISKAEAVLFEDENIEFIVENTSDCDLYIAVLDFSTDGTVSVVWPEMRGAEELLVQNSSWKQTFGTYLPDNYDSVKDILKIFASTEPLDFQFLTLSFKDSQTRDLPTNLTSPLGELLTYASLSRTRGVGREKQGVPLFNWVTAQRVIEVRKR